MDVLTNAHVEKSTNSQTLLPTAIHLSNNSHSIPLKPVIINDDDGGGGGDALASMHGFDYIIQKAKTKRMMISEEVGQHL